MTTDFRASGVRANSSDGLVPHLLIAWSVLAITLSIIWPRYGFFGGDALKATPFTLLATLSWVVAPVALAFAPNLRTRVVHEIAQRRLIVGALVAMYVWRLVAVSLGEDFMGSLTYLMREIIYLFPILFLGLVAFSGPAGRQRAITVIVLCTALVLAVAAVEMATSRTFAQLVGIKFAGDAQLLGIMNASISRGGAIRLQSVFYHPIVFAQYLAWAAPFLLYAATSKRSLVIRGLALATLVVVPFFILKTDARSGIVALFLALTLYGGLLIVRRTGFISFPAALVFALALTLAFAGAQQGQSSIGGLVLGRNATETESSNVRSAMFQRGFVAVKSSPIYGFGDNRAAYHAGFRTPRGFLTIDSAYLSALLDSGWVGLALQLLAWLSAFFAAFKVASRRGAQDIDAAVAASLGAVLMVFAILSIMDNIVLIFISITLIAVTRSPVPRRVPRRAPQSAYRGRQGLPARNTVNPARP